MAVPTKAPVRPANVVVAQGQTLTEGGPSVNVGGKAAVYSAGSVYLDSSTPIAVPKAEDNNVVVAQGQTLTENGSAASIGGKAAVYSAGSLFYGSTPIPIPEASPTNLVVAQGQTLSENGPPAVVGGKTALYKAGSIYYDSTLVAVPTSAQGQQNPPPVVAVGVTFVPAVQTPSPVVANGITFAPAVEKASPVIAGGITFAPVSQSISGYIREPVVAGGITFQASFVQSPNAAEQETPAPLSVDENPVLKAANGGLVIAGSTISQGSTTSLLGHVIAANSDNVVVDGTTHPLAQITVQPVETPTATPLEIANQPVMKAANGGLVIAGTTISQGAQSTLFGHVISVGDNNVIDNGKTLHFAPNTEAAGQNSVTSLIYGSSNIVTTLTPGATYSSGGHIATYTGSTLSALTEATSSVIGTATVPALPSQVHIEASSASTTTPEQLFVETSPSLSSSPSPSSSSAVEYVLNGTTATAASTSNVPIGALILSGLDAVPKNSSLVLPFIAFANRSVASTVPTSTVVGSAPPGSMMTTTSETGGSGKASATRPVHGSGSVGYGTRGITLRWRSLGILLALG